MGVRAFNYYPYRTEVTPWNHPHPVFSHVLTPPHPWIPQVGEEATPPLDTPTPLPEVQVVITGPFDPCTPHVVG